MRQKHRSFLPSNTSAQVYGSRPRTYAERSPRTYGCRELQRDPVVAAPAVPAFVAEPAANVPSAAVAA